MDFIGLPESHAALQFARLWFVMAIDKQMTREKALDFACAQATEYLSNACKISQAKYDAAEWIRKDLEEIFPTMDNPLSRPNRK